MKKGTYYVEQRGQLKALATAARQEIVDCLAGRRPATIAEIAQQLGRPADALYFHVKRLVKVGLVEELAADPDDRQGSARYALIAKRLVLKYRRGTQPEMQRIVRAAVRCGERDFELAYPDRAETQKEGKRDLWAGRVTGWLRPAELAQVNALLGQLSQILSRGAPSPQALDEKRQLMSFTFLLAPAPPPHRYRQGAS